MKKKFTRDIVALQDQMSFLRGIGEKYQYEKCGQSFTLLYGGRRQYCYVSRSKEGELPVGQLYFISKAKGHIKRSVDTSKVKQLYPSQEMIKYRRFNRGIAEGEIFSDCWWLDIEVAYWKAALMMGYITEELYFEGLEMDKRVRLAALGTFAKKKSVYEFDGYHEVLVSEEDSPTPQIFFNCAWKVYRLMEACRRKLGRDFLFYWTDCVFFHKSRNVKFVDNIIRRWGYDGSIVQIEDVIRTDKKFIVYGKQKGKKEYFV